EDETYPCGFCQGSGEKPKGSRCPVCRGAGSVSIEPPAVRCAYCKGRGEEKPRSNVTCTACKGKGVIHVDEPVETCFHCRGTGKEPTNKLVCITCRGKGVVTVKDEEEESWEETQSFDSLQGRLRIPLSDSEGWEPVRSASGSERDALKIVKALGQADRVAVAKGMRPPISSDYAKQLCDALVRKKLLLRHGLIYTLSPNGEKALE
ncbi:MAG: hypothetical protein KJ706_10105, partial [Candidatus Omnitrophica bacterium]|nr:hypothetical protein [Candidatus Omnitrophota bacterium]